MYHITIIDLVMYGNRFICSMTAGVQFMRENPERFIESNTENSWLRYLNNMCTQGTWADASYHSSSHCADAMILIKVTIQIVECKTLQAQGFAM